MTVYHGSTQIIQSPDINFSKNYLNFGKGFYLTTYLNQAKQWAIRKGSRQGKVGIVNEYELLDNWKYFKGLSFENENEQWLEFVCGCRKGELINLEYDIIVGNVADDDIFKTVDMYLRGL
ncbi:MAG: DUF3990 domain-containing protein [Erysipelotrichaceae bacterium]